MKKKISKQLLQTRTDISNAMIDILSTMNLPAMDTITTKAVIVYQYYSELESGGHENLFQWYNEDIKAITPKRYLALLVETLEEIGAPEYAALELQYGPRLWELYEKMQTDDQYEDEFYELSEQATQRYYQIENSIRDRLDDYFVEIYEHFILATDL